MLFICFCYKCTVVQIVRIILLPYVLRQANMRYATLNQSDFSISISLIGYYIAMVSHVF